MKRCLILTVAALAAAGLLPTRAQTFTTPAGVTNIVIVPDPSGRVNTTNLVSQYINNGEVINPQIDAVTFINNGTFLAGSVQPYETSGTLNFINNGFMLGAVGWLFDNSPASIGARQMSASFFNGNVGDIEAVDAGSVIVIGQPNNFLILPSYVQIGATNIVNQGALGVGANGLITVTGGDVALSHSTLAVSTVNEEPLGSQQPIFTNYFLPDLGVYDIYWGQTNMSQNLGNLLNLQGIWDGNIASAPPEPVLSANGGGNSPSFSFSPGALDSYINVLGAMDVTLTNKTGGPVDGGIIFTNANKGAVFVIAPPAFSIQTGFTIGQSNFDTIGVLMTLPGTNAITGVSTPSYIFFQDFLASAPGRGNLINAVAGTGRPTNYITDRLQTFPGSPGNWGIPEPDFFLDSGNYLINTNVSVDIVTNFLTSGDYAAYSAFFDNVASRPPAVVGGTITNLPGSIWIDANNLDLGQTGLRANGMVSIKASHLISSTNAVIDCANLSFDLGSTNGNLRFQNLAASTVGRFSGQIYAWSAEWSNTVQLVFSNNYVQDTTTSNWVQTPLTNLFGIGYHVLMLDASNLRAVQPVYVYDLLLHSSSITLSDPVTVLEGLLLDCKSFTLQSSLSLPGAFPAANPIANTALPATPLTDWIATNAPTVQFFTNNGALSIASVAHFGDDRPPYSTFINAGNLSAGGLYLDSSYFENDGAIASGLGATFIQCGSGKLQNASMSSANVLQFTANTLKFANSQMAVGDSLDFSVTNALFDAGPGAPNTITIQNGLNLRIKPASGDLLGTTILSADTSSTGKAISHNWAGEDRGVSAAGYTNNEALGRLVLTPSQNNRSSFVFSGTGSQNGLYVDLLDLSALGTNVLTEIQINPNLVLYYAAAKLGFTPPTTNGAQMEPEEYLDGKFNGHLRWVQSYAGPNSSVDVIVTNAVGTPVSISVNAALRNSKILDSNGNGIANGSDPNPFYAATLSLQIVGAGIIMPDYTGQLLLVGVPYGMTAQPADGFSFTGWTGSIASGSPSINFIMTNGLSFVANFNSTATPGTYSGLFFEPPPAGIEWQRSGAVSLNTSKGGKYSGALRIANTKYSFSGTLTNGVATANVPTSSGNLSVHLQVGSKQVVGTVTGSGWTADLEAVRSTFNSRTNPAPFAGKYTILFPGADDPTNTTVPFGAGYGTINVSSAGKVQFSGALADGTHISQSSIVAADGSWPFYVPLYAGQGQILGWMTFGASADIDVGGTFNWIKRTNAMSKLYPNGFTLQTNAIGSRYSKNLAPVTGFSSAVVELVGGNLNPPIFQGVNIDAKNKVTPVNDTRFKLTISPSTGVFNGSTTNAAGKTVSFHGALLQNQVSGGGYFLGSTQSGNVFFGPPQ